MKNTEAVRLSLFALATTTFLSTRAASNAWDIGTVTSNACLVADRYLADNPYDTKLGKASLNWEYGALWNGVAAFALSDRSLRYHDYLVKFGDHVGWGYHTERLYHADDHCVGQAYLELAMADDMPGRADLLRQLYDFICFQAPATSDPLAWNLSKPLRRWTWCDALFMSPTVLSRLASFTGEEKYRDFLDAEYRATTEFLYDKQDKLFHRDSSFFGKTCPNGKTVYWSRGNGWVFGSLAIILRDAPKNWKSRGWYEDLFKTLAASLKAIQQPDGTWHSSLLDPDHPAGPEMSGTCFFAYAMLWGMNNGLLSEKDYEPAVQKAWAAISAAIDDEGRLGYMQRIDAQPNASAAHEQAPYGVGAYLCAAVEMKTYLVRHAHPAAKVIDVTNPCGFFRPAETVALKLADLGCGGGSAARVYDLRNGAFLPHQAFDSDGDGKMDELLFSTYLLARGTRSFLVFDDAAALDGDNAKVCDALPCPFRLDDFAWENDRLAHRIYGFGVSQKPPKGEGLVSSGIDYYNKCVAYPVMNTWLHTKHYHENHGEGMDNYKVGPGRGCGGISVRGADGTWRVSGNWVPGTDKVLATGPVRAVFEIQYKPWFSAEPETRRVTIDRGQTFSRMEMGARSLAKADLIGPGLDISAPRGHAGDIRLSQTDGWIANFEPQDGTKGRIETAILLAPGYVAALAQDQQDCLALLTRPAADGKVVWYMGGAWDLAGHFRTADEWTAHVKDFADGLRTPPVVTIR